MAEYKTADKLPILEEVTETTYALVEEGGALKRVSGELLGGSKCCVINIIHPEATEPAEVDPSSEITYTCNMTYDELKEALQNKTLVGFNVNVYQGVQMAGNIVSEVYFGTDAPGIMIQYGGMNGSGILQFLANNTITGYTDS